MIRRFFPKGTSFKDISRNEIKRIERWTNNYPREMFGFKSANDIFKKTVKSCLEFMLYLRYKYLRKNRAFYIAVLTTFSRVEKICVISIIRLFLFIGTPLYSICGEYYKEVFLSLFFLFTF